MCPPPSPCPPSLLLHSWGHLLTQTLTLPSLSPLSLQWPGPTIRLLLKTPQACFLSYLPSPPGFLDNWGCGADECPAVRCSPGCPWSSLAVYTLPLPSTLIFPRQHPGVYLPCNSLTCCSLFRICLSPQNVGSLWRGSFACLVHCCVQGPGAQSMLSMYLLNLHLQTVHAQLSSEQTLSNLQSRL